jgi:hypothetical protein
MQLPKEERTTRYKKAKGTTSVYLKSEHDFYEKDRSGMK